MPRRGGSFLREPKLSTAVGGMLWVNGALLSFSLYLTLISDDRAQGTLAVIEISNSSSEGNSRHKRIPALENVLFGDFSLNKGQVEIFSYRLATLDYPLRVVLAMDTQSEATVR